MRFAYEWQGSVLFHMLICSFLLLFGVCHSVAFSQITGPSTFAVKKLSVLTTAMIFAQATLLVELLWITNL